MIAPRAAMRSPSAAKSIMRGIYNDTVTALEEGYPTLEEVKHELKTTGEGAKAALSAFDHLIRTPAHP